jgi:hypothetical protein
MPTPPSVMPSAVPAMPSALTSGGQLTSAMLKHVNEDMALYWIHSARRDSTRKEIDGLAKMVQARTEQMKALNRLVEISQTCVAWSEGKGDGPGTIRYLNQNWEGKPTDNAGEAAENLKLYTDLSAAGCNMANTRRDNINNTTYWINTKDDKQVMIQALKARLDELNALQGMDMQRLDSLNKKYNESTEWLTNFERSRSQTAATISNE